MLICDRKFQLSPTVGHCTHAVDRDRDSQINWNALKEPSTMFGSKNAKQKLEMKYAKLLDESFRLSSTDRKRSDLKAAEADEVRRQLDALEKES